MHGVFLEINIHEPGHAKNCSFAITNVCCKVFVFASAGVVTVLVFAISEQYEYSDSLKDQTRLKAVKSVPGVQIVERERKIKRRNPHELSRITYQNAANLFYYLLYFSLALHYLNA